MQTHAECIVLITGQSVTDPDIDRASMGSPL
jgi:hypothetical protein